MSEEQFTYNRSWEEIEDMLDRAERLQHSHYTKMQRGTKKKRIEHMRNYKALQGVIKSLRWVLGDRRINHPLN
mgnify:CR=1 FL=1|tara:strand:+ start:1039 stop:1257 length:219 start_codon:yes stop_codon:yes gene_type:complete